MVEVKNESVKEEVVDTTATIDDILKVVNKVNKKVFKYPVWIPSLKKEVSFTELTTEQQKRIVKTIVNSPLYQAEFMGVMKDVVKENCTDSKIDVDKLNIIDKFFILLKMRSVSIGKQIKLENKKMVDLDEILDKAKEKVKTLKPKPVSDDEGIYEILVRVPTIENEYLVDIGLQDNVITNIDEQNINVATIKGILGETFTSEIVKYISTVSIKDDDETVNINFDNMGFTDRIKILELIPTKVTEKVVAYIEKVRKEIDKLVIVKTIGDDGKVKEEKLSIDGSFFTSSSK